MRLHFVELRPFTRRLGERLSPESYRRLQMHLLAEPETGVLIPVGGGLRKIRWADEGRGKRGGVRVIYYLVSRSRRLYLLDLYAKNEKADLTRDELKRLAALLADLA